MAKHPLGVSLLAMLYGLMGVALIFALIPINVEYSQLRLSNPFKYSERLANVISGIVLLSGLFCFATAYGLWHLRDWSLYIVGVMAIGLPLFVGIIGYDAIKDICTYDYSINEVSIKGNILCGTILLCYIIINIIVLWYLYRIRRNFR